MTPTATDTADHHDAVLTENGEGDFAQREAGSRSPGASSQPLLNC